MFGLKKKSHKPTTSFALALCIHLVAFVMTTVGMFTPHWAQITEQTGVTTADIRYNRGLVVSCSPSGSCEANEDVSGSSEIFFGAYVMGILAVIVGFFILQVFFISMFVQSCRESNLGGAISAISIFEGALLMLVLILFEMSISEEVSTEGNILRKSTFGYSRGIIMGAIVLYFVAALFIIVEHVRRRRRKNDIESTRSTPVTRIKQVRRPSPPPKPSFSSYRGRRSILVAPSVTNMPPPYSNQKKGSMSTTGRPSLPGSEVDGAGMTACDLPGCQACDYVGLSNIFMGPGGSPFKIKERLDCQDKGLVYAIICMRDDHVFIGHTLDKLETIFSLHMANIKAMNLSDPVAYHFTRPEHKIQDIRVTALAKLDADMDTRERLEKVLSYDMDRPHDSYTGMDNNFTFL